MFLCAYFPKELYCFKEKNKLTLLWKLLESIDRSKNYFLITSSITILEGLWSLLTPSDSIMISDSQTITIVGFLTIIHFAGSILII